MSRDFHQAKPDRTNADSNKDKEKKQMKADCDPDETDGPEKIVILMKSADGDEDDDSSVTKISIGEDGSTGEPVIEKQTNTFAAKKSAAQGMMDIALITANANQLRYIVEFLNTSWNYYVVLTLVIVSLALQITVGMALIFKGKLALRGKSKNLLLNNFITVGVFLITIINIFVASFTDTGNKKNK